MMMNNCICFNVRFVFLVMLVCVTLFSCRQQKLALAQQEPVNAQEETEDPKQ